MQHIPAEIINEILKHLVPNILLVHNPGEFRWNVGQICASWRAVFTSTPWIWRKFSVDVTQITYRNLDDAVHLVKLCIQRSRNQPISFSLLYYDRSHASYATCLSQGKMQIMQCVNQILSDLIAESQRWEVVEVEPPLISLKAFCPPNLLNPFPLLRSMALQSPTVWMSERWKLFLCTHSLTRVEVSSLPTYDFDWSRLTVLTLHHAVRVADVLHVMRRLRCIEKLQLKFSKYSSEADEEQDGTIALPTLKVLSCPGDVLRHLSAPALEELHLRMESCDIRAIRAIRASLGLPWPDGTISFLRTSSGSLTRLILGRRCCNNSGAKRILQELPNMTKLCVLVDLDLLDILSYNLEEGLPVLPKLELLIVDQDQPQAVETLCATVTSRTSKPSLFEWPYGTGKLKELRMIRDIHCEGDTSRLRLLCEEREVTYLALERAHMVGHQWCSGVKSCAFDLCNNDSLFHLETESLWYRWLPSSHFRHRVMFSVLVQLYVFFLLFRRAPISETPNNIIRIFI
ncbi:hypothetical protein M378DRAFT_533772 [Amanita muscaria Koide BX008]|uniref:F-box domain-containing protein n=1 Tax=Amanita muscaria (strain Koide BX008) TaxID=946122 RepID=A0A0C2SPQ1_AMAMK|nr:hypothetical protein M378DRAFT_533772 [Amanita muscaria Koide BX008]